jgi:hypothetical protein
LLLQERIAELQKESKPKYDENRDVKVTVTTLKHAVNILDESINKYCLINSCEYAKESESLISPLGLQKYQLYPENSLVSYMRDVLME